MADPASNTTYPATIEVLPEIEPNTKENDPGQEHDVMHDKANATLNALQAFVGTTADTSAAPSIVGRVLALEEADPGGGDFTGPGSSTDNALVRFDGAGGKTGQNSGVLVTDNNEISGYRGHLNRQTGTTYTLQASDSGKIVELSNAASIALTAANSLPVGFACTIVQGGAGQVTIASTGSGSVVNRQSQFKTAGQNAMCGVYVRSNSGTNAVFVFGGDTAA